MGRRAAAAAWVIALGGLCAAAPIHALPRFEQVRADHRPSDLTLLDRHGTPIQTLRVDPRARRLPWVPLQDMSPALREAIVMSEDQRFWAHSGVDWKAVAASAWANVWNQRTRGASTVTMQLAGLIDAEHARPAGGRSVTGKLGQAWSARALDAQWRKSDILEAYLNLVPLRGELIGLPALSLTLFGKHPNALDAQESAVAAALARSPNATPTAVSQRACQVLRLMQPGHRCQGLALFTAAALQRRGGMPLGEQAAPHAARQVVAALRQAGLGTVQHPWPATVRTTLDARLQRLATRQLRQQLMELSRREVEDGAVIVLDNRSGEVLAWVGSAGAMASAREVDGVIARRQPGSTLKPFVYELAFERGLLTPASLLDDSPVQMPTANGVYTPQNYDRRFKGWVSVRQALGSSLNIPAVRAGAMLGPEALAQRLNSLGLGLKHPGGFYGPGLALGSAEVTLRDLSNAYRSLAQGGLLSPITWLREPAAGQAASKPPRPRRAMDAAASYLVTDILADNNARAATFGLDSLLATRGFAAVKTGTSKDMRDNWCVGFSDRYTVGVWVGNASGEPMQAVSGVSGAAPVWARVMAELHDGEPSRPPPPPPGVVQSAVRFAGWAAPEASRHEWFKRGTQQAVWQVQPSPNARAIQHPQDGAVYALDPDMPPAVQQLTFKAPHAGGSAGGSWWLNGVLIGYGQSLHWQPRPGKHRLELRLGSGVKDEVRFEVRGAGLKDSKLQRPR
ncbi:MAG: penicillin-binding protein 1C [Rubrivivax sp.]|nr:MAG: penicillin-binding protein 1C [Rubrivivax sp.]